MTNELLIIAKQCISENNINDLKATLSFKNKLRIRYKYGNRGKA